MKNLSIKILSKKISMVFVASVLVSIGLFFINPVFAAGAYFNTNPSDHQTLRTGNYSTNGSSCTTCWAGSVMADTGDIVSFDIYYHNTSADTATQTKVRANIPSGNFNSFTVAADLYAANATAITGTSLVSLSSTQNLTFIPGSVNWYPNQSATPVSLLYGQSGNEIITTGLNIGDVSAGWGTQGHVTFRVRVGGGQQQNQAPAITTNPATSINQNNAVLNASINPNGNNTTAWFEYSTSQSFGSTIGNQTIGNGNSSVNISAYLFGLLSNTTYYYRIVASNQYGTSYGNTLSFNAQNQQNYYQQNYYELSPLVITNSVFSITQNSAVLNGSINPNSVNTNTWFEYGTTQSLGYTTGSQSIRSENYNINITASISGLLSNTTYYYRAVASNQYGTSYGNILSFTTSQSFQLSQGLAPVVTTNPANVFYTNLTLLNGAVNANGAITTAWFEYGATQSLGQTTNSQPMGMGTIAYNYSYILSNLNPNTTYYFRAVARNAYGINYGTILSFMSPAAVAVAATNNAAVNNASLTTVVKTSANLNSLAVVLVSDVDKFKVIKEDKINYIVVYKNISNSGIIDAEINIILPEGVEYQGANIDYSSQSGKNTTFDIGKILANGQGSVSIKAKINNSAKAGELILNANMKYVDNKNINQLAETSSIIIVKEIKSNSNLTASLFDTMGSFLESWLFNLALLGMVLGLGIYVVKYLKQ